MLAVVASATLVGLEASLVSVEVDVSPYGLPYTKIVGLPARVVQESKERVRSAIRNSGVAITARKTTVNLSPASLPKEQSYLDLPIALGVLQGHQKIPPLPRGYMVVGELSLDGSLKWLRGVTAIAQLAHVLGCTHLIFPKLNSADLHWHHGLTLLPAENLSQVIDHFIGKVMLPAIEKIAPQQTTDERYLHAVFPQGNSQAKRAIQISLAGNHHLLLYGQPGTGKTMIARSVPYLMPLLSENEREEVTTILSAAGELKAGQQTFPPFRAPHHTATQHDLLGGGARQTPGEITLAHRGILFLDELAEFSSQTINALRQPIEKGSIDLLHKGKTTTYPSRFALLAATNLCPCGYFGSVHAKCRCSAAEIARYQRKISGPLLDRIDMQVQMEEFSEKNTLYEQVPESFVHAIARAKATQRTRYAGSTVHANGELSSYSAQRYCKLEHRAAQLLKEASNQLQFSMRKYVAAMRVAQTIADLDPNTPQIVQREHIAEAMQLCRAVSAT